jgi:hypothetical protein
MFKKKQHIFLSNLNRSFDHLLHISKNAVNLHLKFLSGYEHEQMCLLNVSEIIITYIINNVRT